MVVGADQRLSNGLRTYDTGVPYDPGFCWSGDFQCSGKPCHRWRYQVMVRRVANNQHTVNFPDTELIPMWTLWTKLNGELTPRSWLRAWIAFNHLHTVQVVKRDEERRTGATCSSLFIERRYRFLANVSTRIQYTRVLSTLVISGR